MLRELLSIFRSGSPLKPLGESFATMIDRAVDLTVKAGHVYFGEPTDSEEAVDLGKQDVKINKLQRKIRKRVMLHLSVQANSPDLPYCLVLISLIKDVERIGDYAKDLSEIRAPGAPALPAAPTAQELRQIRAGIEEVMGAISEVFATSDHEQAKELIGRGRELTERCDALLRTMAAQGEYDAATHTAIVLGTQYYKRLCGHVLNVLSSTVVPLHRLDYYDEKDIAAGVEVS